MNLILTNQELMERVRAGDRGAFHPLVERYQQRIKAYFCRCGVPSDLIDDLTQATLLRMYETARTRTLTGATNDSIDRLVFSAAGSVHRDEVRRGLVRRETLDHYFRLVREEQAKAADADHDAEETTSVVQRAIRLLHPKHRRLIERHYLDGKTIAELANELGMSPNTIKARITRAREILVILLAPYWKGSRHDDY